MLASAPAGQLSDWMAYYVAEPFGEDWRRSSAAACLTANEIRSVTAGLAGKKPEYLDIDDLVPGSQNRKQLEDKSAALAAIDAMEW